MAQRINETRRNIVEDEYLNLNLISGSVAKVECIFNIAIFYSLVPVGE